MWRMFQEKKTSRSFHPNLILATSEHETFSKVFCSNKYFAYFRCRISEFLIKFPVFTNEIISVFPPKLRFWCEDDDSGAKSNFPCVEHSESRPFPISNVIISQYCGAIFSCRRGESMGLSSETCRKLMQFYDGDDAMRVFHLKLASGFSPRRKMNIYAAPGPE